jgi:hypothetical protein
MLKARLLAGGGAETLYVDDVFSAYTYTGNGATQTITNGIDLAGKGGLVWTKHRGTAYHHFSSDSAVGLTYSLIPDATDGVTGGGISGFTSSGFTLPAENATNQASQSFVAWTFRKAAKFFDVVTYTGNGANRTISHSLGQAPGMIVIKRTDSTSPWTVYHRSLANTEYLVLNTTAAKVTGATTYWNSTTADASTFALGTSTDVNTSAATYVAYLFAHDTATDGLIQCGTFTTDGSGNATVSLGWEPQFSMWKTTSGPGSWYMSDTSRGSTADGAINYLLANTSGAEASGTGYKINATGFTVAGFGASVTYIYLAIRRPNKPPTVGTQVYSAIARTGTGAAATVTGVGFAPDLVHIQQRSSAGNDSSMWDRLRGIPKWVATNTTIAEASVSNEVLTLTMDGMTLGTGTSNLTNPSGPTFINHFFKRAPGVFDQVCYTGTGVAKTEAHNLGVVPELMIVKVRNYGFGWQVYSKDIPITQVLQLELDYAPVTKLAWNSTTPIASVFSLGTSGDVNANAATYVSYLFATKAGISKVGSYTGTGTTNAIDCGFTTGARFVLIKRTDSTGDWYVWDTVRGIIAGNDPYLLLNSTAAEVTSTDYIDSYTSGFELSSTAPAAINASGGTYIYLAFA